MAKYAIDQPVSGLVIVEITSNAPQSRDRSYRVLHTIDCGLVTDIKEEAIDARVREGRSIYCKGCAQRKLAAQRRALNKVTKPPEINGARQARHESESRHALSLIDEHMPITKRKVSGVWGDRMGL